MKSVKSKAEILFAATLKKDKQVLDERNRAQQERAGKVSRLKALRLAKEFADKEGTEA